MAACCFIYTDKSVCTAFEIRWYSSHFFIIFSIVFFVFAAENRKNMTKWGYENKGLLRLNAIRKGGKELRHFVNCLFTCNLFLLWMVSCDYHAFRKYWKHGKYLAIMKMSYTKHVKCWKWKIGMGCEILERRTDTNREIFAKYRNAVLNVERYLKYRGT